MPILATGSRESRSSEAGVSLVELLAVMAILSLMIGAVVLNLPSPRSETDRATDTLAAWLDRYLADGAVAGEMRALGASDTELALFRHDGMVWQRAGEWSWPDTARITLRQGDTIVELDDTAEPLILFEPYGRVPNFTLSVSDRNADYVLSADARGRITRTVQR